MLTAVDRYLFRVRIDLKLCFRIVTVAITSSALFSGQWLVRKVKFAYEPSGPVSVS